MNFLFAESAEPRDQTALLEAKDVAIAELQQRISALQDALHRSDGESRRSASLRRRE